MRFFVFQLLNILFVLSFAISSMADNSRDKDRNKSDEIISDCVVTKLLSSYDFNGNLYNYNHIVLGKNNGAYFLNLGWNSFWNGWSDAFYANIKFIDDTLPAGYAQSRIHHLNFTAPRSGILTGTIILIDPQGATDYKGNPVPGQLMGYEKNQLQFQQIAELKCKAL